MNDTLLADLRVGRQENTAHGAPRNQGGAHCPPSSAASAAACSSPTLLRTSPTIVGLLTALRRVLDARPVTDGEVLVILPDGRAGRYAHMCESCAEPGALIIILAAPAGDARTGPVFPPGPDPTSP